MHTVLVLSGFGMSLDGVLLAWASFASARALRLQHMQPILVTCNDMDTIIFYTRHTGYADVSMTAHFDDLIFHPFIVFSHKKGPHFR